ncbi:MAG: nitroimidazol reductase NimA-like FMN-containing flavoprotein [Glaciecola sp.]|jgi:nitroimidazol reductase NimA-like FMN-containing flavoprotein (pyridoxamine 5'-phosphate oxidase superfamily)
MDNPPEAIPVLSEAACRSLLASQYVGRLGYILHDRPVIVPVNYRVDDTTGDILVFSRPGKKLEAARHGNSLCFQIDGTDDLRHGGWSVLVSGCAQVIEAPDARTIAEEQRLRPWPEATAGMALIRLTPESIEGRRLR